MTRADPTPGGAWTGTALGLAGIALLHALVLGALFLAMRPAAEGGLAYPQNTGAGYLAFFYMINPGLTAIVLLPVGALLLRRRSRALVGFAGAVGLVVLLNAACWGVVTTGAWR